MNTSIEVEYWVVDSDGNLTEPGPLADVSSRTEREFVEPLFEVKTPPCETIPELRTALVGELEEVLSRAAERDKHLVPFGTPINGGAIDRRPDEGGRIQKAAVGSNFDYAKYCAGTHVHIEKRNVTDQLNTLIALDPALALVNSSPYFQGERIANGARAYCYRKKSYEEFPKHGQLWRYVDNVGEWHRRLEHRYEEFKAAAVDAGVDGAAVDEHFSPDDVVWTPVRLRDSMPTVEWRSPDAALPSQLLRLAEDLRTVMERLPETTVRIDGESVSRRSRDGSGDDGGAGAATASDSPADRDGPTARPGHATEEGIALPAFETVCDLAESAIHDGLESPAVAGYLERMGFSVGDYHPIAARIDGRQYVTEADARDLRLEYASRLEEDVADLARS
ncbi:glutamate-cysteine ligase family protein [Natrinema sp. 1APR25-10V2]|uniref:glutamate-cysteine ligase family protein n=1 Tax=Natrinema sp. 1APR25-10V2 TaxID=2951081 RepID=UPI0028745F02|nr:glutamate-cysteine ligase family protein [Natrinema sp. 1APR25-10V2]MDS0476337.1 glutamate-cysteine ligase family protein [Natrinema sp. 1APR25-10V2]